MSNAVPTETTQAANPRRERGLALYKAKKPAIRHIVAGKFLVPSATTSTDYVVDTDERRCTCPDHADRAVKCKHMWAVSFFREEVVMPDGTTVVTEAVQAVAVRRRTYPQESWTAYRQGQRHELSTSKVLLKNLLLGVEEPSHAKTGRKPFSYADAIFAATMKVYGTLSAYRTDDAIRECKDDGFIEKAPAPNSVLRTIGKPELYPVLTALVEESAKPLAHLETRFSPDASGFASQTYVRWFDRKHGKDTRVQQWMKLHVMVGTHTNIITAARVTRGHVGDSKMFPALINATARSGFTMAEVSADKAYLAHEHLDLIELHGATPYIPLKSNSTGRGSPAMTRLAHAFAANEEDFLRHYHIQSNVEATFSALKRKFGENVRAKNPDAQANEIILKCLCFNLSRLVHAIHTFGIEPKFWGGATTPTVPVVPSPTMHEGAVAP